MKAPDKLECPHCGKECEDVVGCVLCGASFCEQCGSAPEGICDVCGTSMEMRLTKVSSENPNKPAKIGRRTRLPDEVIAKIKHLADDDMGMFDGDVADLLKRLRRSAWHRWALCREIEQLRSLL